MFVVRVTDAASMTATTAAQSLTINPAALTITAPSLAPGTVNSPYMSAAYTASGGTSPYTFSLASGSLPAGLSLNSGSGVISGTPTTAGTSMFVVRVTDAASMTATTAAQSLTINPAALTITAPSLAPGTVNSPYTSSPYTASGGTSPYTFSIASGSLPAGLSLNSASGVLSGTPTTAGTSMFVVRVTDAASMTATTAAQSLTINPPALTITAPSLAPGTVNSPYTSSPYTASGGTSPYTFSIASGSLPAGLSLNSGSGVISGTPTTAGTSMFVVRVTDAASMTATTAAQSLTINPPALTITAPTLAPGTANSPYTSSPYTASGGTSPYTFSIASGSLPTGLSLNSASGVLSGTPTTAGTSMFVVKVTDYAQNTASTAPQSLTINPPALTITAPTLAPGTANSPYTSSPYTASGGTSPYTFSIASGSFPPA